MQVVPVVTFIYAGRVDEVYAMNETFKFIILHKLYTKDLQGLDVQRFKAGLEN